MRELALHVLDILQNTVEAHATRVALTIDVDGAADRLTITVIDNGRGMDAATVARVTDPFYTTRTTRHVGLGLPLLAAAAERADGGLAIRSEVGTGTTVRATFRLRHPDRQPLGDMAGVLLTFLLASAAPDLHYVHTVQGETTAGMPPGPDSDCFEFDTEELRAALDGVPLTTPVVRRWLAEFLAEGESTLGGV